MNRDLEEKLDNLAETQRAILRILLLLGGLAIPSGNQEAVDEFYSILESLKSSGKT